VNNNVRENNFFFLRGGGEMGHLTRSHDWSQRPIGMPDQWPRALQISLGNILYSGFPMFLFWGEDLTCFYNDAFRPSLGQEGKHPAVGKSGKEVWPEIWDFIGPLIEKVMKTGEPVWFEDQYLPFYRNGKMEDIYWTFSYSLALNDDGAPGGVLVTCMETTATVQARERTETSKKAAEWQKRQYETITSSTPDLIYIFDLNYRFTYANTALLNMWGKSWETAIGKSLLENGYEPWHAEMHEREIDEIIATKKPLRGEVAFPHAELGKRIYDYILVPVFGDNGEVEAVAGTTRDITELKQAALSITESEERFRNLADDSPIFVFIIDPDPGAPVKYWNETWLQYTGQSLEQAIGTAWNGIIHEEDVPVVMKHYMAAFENREPYFIPAVRVKRYDGEYRWHSFKGNPRYLPGREFNGFVGVGIDIHEQKLAEKILEESEQNLRSMILQSPVAMCILLGPDHIVDIANEAMIKLWGKPAENLLHQPIFKGLPDAREQGLEILLDNVFAKSERFKAEERPVELLRNGHKETVYQDFVYEPYRNTAGHTIGVLVVTIDVTAQVIARKQIEDVVTQRTAELAQVNESLQRANKELQRSNQYLEEFAHAASHDLKEPIRKIHLFTQQLKQQLSSQLQEPEYKLFGRIENASLRMRNLIDDLLEYSYVSQLPLQMETVDLFKTIQQVLEDLELNIEEKKAIIHIDKLPTIHGYKRQLQQLFQNLLSNALKYSTPDVRPQINVTASTFTDQHQSYLLISVSDNGIGFEQKHAEKIFKMFSRLHGPQEYSGTGVGLSIAKKVVENHNGFIKAESQPGHGATFNIFLPV
jgi:PAS domain S-box-containing protein